MRELLARALSCVALLLGGPAACSPGGGNKFLEMFDSHALPPGEWGISNGYYTFENGGLSPNECGYVPDSGSFDDYVGGEVLVTGAALEVDIENGPLLVYEVDGLDLYDPSSPGPADFDFNDSEVAFDAGLSQTYDCIVTQDIQFTGSITGVNRFRLEDSLDFTGTGSECKEFAAAFGFAQFPCITVDGADAVLE